MLKSRGRGWTEATDRAYALALSLTKGSYQRGIVEGYEALSGSTLRGRAKNYGAHYAKSRDAFLKRCRAAGIAIAIHARAHGKKILVLTMNEEPIVPLAHEAASLEGDNPA